MNWTHSTGGGSVAVGVNGAGSDDVAALQVQLPVAVRPVGVLAVTIRMVCAVARRSISRPSLRCVHESRSCVRRPRRATVRVPTRRGHGQRWLAARLLGEPGLQAFLGGVVGGADFEAIRGFPVLINLVEQLTK